MEQFLDSETVEIVQFLDPEYVKMKQFLYESRIRSNVEVFESKKLNKKNTKFLDKYSILRLGFFSHLASQE